MDRRSFLSIGAIATAVSAITLQRSEATERRQRFSAVHPSRSKRLGIIAVSCEVMNYLAPSWRTQQHSLGLDELRKALLLPDNCRVDAVSEHYLFCKGQIALRVECEDFRECPSGCIVEDVTPWYCFGIDGLPQFDGWGTAALSNVGPFSVKRTV
jgi:hypothetical protein